MPDPTADRLADGQTVPPVARAAILAWYAERGRPLAFRRTTDPYAILVSEAMAQQTQAARAAAYWERFMARFPTVEALAEATPADVLREWAGLGYDRRALALWRTARVIVEQYGGRMPSTVPELEALPGVGPYTARAVAALSFGLPVGAVDVNVRRVLGRIAAGSVDALSPAAMQALADAIVPTDDPGAWTHALMDVGATICKPRAPRCGECPARRWCRYAASSEALGAGTSVAAGSSGAADPSGAAGPSGAAAPFVGRDRAAAPKRVREAPAPFHATTRWLRGRIMDRLRAAPGDDWVPLDGGIGDHDHERVATAARSMARDGVIELDARPDGTLWARLPLA